MRLVFDTNSIVSALLFERGRLAWLRTFWQRREHTLLVSKATTQELLRVLAYPKFKLGEEQIEALLTDYLPFVESINLSGEMLQLPHCRDANDQMFIELASVGQADILITGDDDLLVMAGQVQHSILSPADFYRQMHA